MEYIVVEEPADWLYPKHSIGLHPNVFSSKGKEYRL